MPQLDLTRSQLHITLTRTGQRWLQETFGLTEPDVSQCSLGRLLVLCSGLGRLVPEAVFQRLALTESKGATPMSRQDLLEVQERRVQRVVAAFNQHLSFRASAQPVRISEAHRDIGPLQASRETIDLALTRFRNAGWGVQEAEPSNPDMSLDREWVFTPPPVETQDE